MRSHLYIFDTQFVHWETLTNIELWLVIIEATVELILSLIFLIKLKN